MSEAPVTVVSVGDPHFKVSNVRETTLMVEAIVNFARSKSPTFIVVMGDVLDRHESIHVSPLTRAINFLSQLRAIAPTYVLIGNHDLKNNRQFLSDEHPFTALKYWDNMYIVDKTIKLDIRGQTFTFVPYVPPGRLEEALDIIPREEWMRSSDIYAHQEIKGAKMGAIVSTEGDEWPLTYPHVTSGHIHDYQEPQPNVIYVGTPIQHAFGDRHDKTISYFTYYPDKTFDHERIDLRLPRKRIIRLTCDEVSGYVPQDNSDLKIIISGTAGEIKAIMKHPNVEMWRRSGHKVVYKSVAVTVEEVAPMPSKAPLRFSTVLYNTICSNQRLAAIYNNIFGSVRTLSSNGLTVTSLNLVSSPTAR